MTAKSTAPSCASGINRTAQTDSPSSPASSSLKYKDDQGWTGLASGVDPVGYSGHLHGVTPGPRLGKRIGWKDLPRAVRDLARQEWPDLVPPKDALTPDQEAAIRRFRERHGKSWKLELSVAWTTGRDASMVDGALLRQVRNELGPRWLNAQD